MAQELSQMSKRIDSLESKMTVKTVKFARARRTRVGASANGAPMGLSMLEDHMYASTGSASYLSQEDTEEEEEISFWQGYDPDETSVTS